MCVCQSARLEVEKEKNSYEKKEKKKGSCEKNEKRVKSM